MAPEFTLESLDGENISLSDFKGKVVYIFWFGYG
jgi:peroxiredoxin